MKTNHCTLYPLLILFVLLFSGCKEFVSVDPPKSELITETVFQNDGTANAAMTSVYSLFVSEVTTFHYAFYPGLYSDELIQYLSRGPFYDVYQYNQLEAFNYPPASFWNRGYKYIYLCNAVIEGCSESSFLTEPVKRQLIAEAKFMRAYWHFMLLNLYGDVPLVLATRYGENMKASRAPVEEVYKQIIGDLQEAIKDLYPDYVNANALPSAQERVRPNRSAAQALLARVYLYHGDYSLAGELATQVIDRRDLYDTVSIDKVFLKESREAIWQLPPSSSISYYNTQEGRNFVPSSPTNPPVFGGVLTNRFMKSFEPGDLRKVHWTGMYVDKNASPPDTLYYPYKYKIRTGSPVTEYSAVFRLAELYLIRAEARAMLGDLSGSREDLNVIRRRAGLPDTHADTQEALLDAILRERRVELFTEYGHRWFDLKRTGKADAVMSAYAPEKGATWHPDKKLWPIAQTEIDKNPNLVQNPGYESGVPGGN